MSLKKRLRRKENNMAVLWAENILAIAQAFSWCNDRKRDGKRKEFIFIYENNMQLVRIQLIF